jgi:hypothetical protein
MRSCVSSLASEEAVPPERELTESVADVEDMVEVVPVVTSVLVLLVVLPCRLLIKSLTSVLTSS